MQWPCVFALPFPTIPLLSQLPVTFTIYEFSHICSRVCDISRRMQTEKHMVAMHSAAAIRIVAHECKLSAPTTSICIISIYKQTLIKTNCYVAAVTFRIYYVVFFCTGCLFTPSWDTTSHRPSWSDKLVTGVTGADHHHLLCCTWRTPVKHLLSQTSSQDSAGVCTVHNSATFMWFAEAGRQKHLCVNHTGAWCVYRSPTARGVSLHIQAVSVAALSADRRNSVTKQQGDWHPSSPPRRSAWRCTHRWML